MCTFVSWIEYKGENYYLTKQDLQTKKGKELLKYEYKDDIEGHGAILHYYPELKDKNGVLHKECDDFSTPANFPNDIVKAIKRGDFRGFGVCLGILNKQGREKYDKIERPAEEEYFKIKRPAKEEYEKIERSAWEEYEKIVRSAYKEYKKTINSAEEEYKKIEHSAEEEYLKIRRSAWEEYLKIQRPAKEEYLKIKHSAEEEYKKTINSAFWDLAIQSKYRRKEWV